MTVVVEFVSDRPYPIVPEFKEMIYNGHTAERDWLDSIGIPGVDGSTGGGNGRYDLRIDGVLLSDLTAPNRDSIKRAIEDAVGVTVVRFYDESPE